MSFQDLERGLGERAPLARDVDISPEADLRFKALSRQVSMQIHKINANVSAINKLVELLGTPKDTPDLRHKLHNLTDATREILKDSNAEVKHFANSDLAPTDRQHRYEQQKVSGDFQKALVSFQAASKRSAEKQRLFVERAKVAINDATTPTSDGARQLSSASHRGDFAATSDPLLELDENPTGGQQQQQQLVEGIPDTEFEFQEQLIQEREEEIEQIEQGITELNQIFRDLGQIVGEQQSMIDNIETNVRSVASDTRGASTELTQAHAYQRRAGRRMFCLLLTFLLVLSIVLLAILS
ncbi:BQ5605_C012g07040 [Microbotryum silenes-dioicae]|uniref:BQ5605_C012g07040 protein n=1 Tax=Microbotryum silenes-dioicae TaxID=796604 RepID=A0A2X0NVV2_9BASI|nr:BQ5605_C012g07040 [Microbotryum silenes-dioicae]